MTTSGPNYWLRECIDRARSACPDGAAEEAQAELDALAARLAEAERDAERYRYYRAWMSQRTELHTGRVYSEDDIDAELDAFILRNKRATASASPVACEHCGATDRHFGGCYYAGQRVTQTVSAGEGPK